MKSIPIILENPIAIFVETSKCGDTTLYMLCPFSKRAYFMYMQEETTTVYKGNEGDKINVEDFIKRLNKKDVLATKGKLPYGKILHWEYIT